MSKRYVARVALPGRSRRGRLRTDGPPVARGVATPPADRATAPSEEPPVGGALGPSGDAPAGGQPATANPPPATDPLPEPTAKEASRARGVATPPPTGDAGSTQLLQAPDVTAEIFVDRSGRRARMLRRVVSAAVLLALLLILALWVSQGVDALGLPA